MYAINLNVNEVLQRFTILSLYLLKFELEFILKSYIRILMTLFKCKFVYFFFDELKTKYLRFFVSDYKIYKDLLFLNQIEWQQTKITQILKKNR